MNLWWWAGFSKEVLEHVHSRKSVRVFLDQLAQSFIFLWFFIVSGAFGFFIIATHDFFIALFGSLVFGFVQWNVIRLTNASIHIAPHEYDSYLRASTEYQIQKAQWDSLTKEEQKKKPAPKEIVLRTPSFFKPTLFFMTLSVLSGMTWGIGLSTDYIVELKGPPKDIIIQEVLTRIQLASANSWLQIGGFIGMLIAFVPSFIRWINSAVIQEMYMDVVAHNHTHILNIHKQHVTKIQQHLHVSTSHTQFLDPPFNQMPKIMGWIDVEQCSTVKIPKWEPNEEEKGTEENTEPAIEESET